MSSATLPAPLHLNGRSLFTGRLLYALLLLLCLTMIGLSLSYKFAQGTSGCDSTYNAEWAAQGQWCAEWFQAIEEMGITAVTFESYFLALRLIVALPFFALSLLLVWRRGHELRVLLFAGLLLLMGIAGTWFNPFWGWAEGWSYPAVERLSQLLTYLLIGGAVLFACLFPDGRFVPRWSRWLAGSFLLLYAANIFFSDTNLAWDNWPFPLNTLVPLAFILFSVAVIIIRYRRQATAVQRQQIKWVTFGFLLIALNLLLDFAVFNIYPALTGSYPLTTGRQAMLWELGQDTLSHLSQLALAICFGLAVFRHRLWDIDPILNRTLVYGSLTALIIILYIAIVGGLGALFHTPTNAVTGLVATAVIAILFQPLRDRLQRGVNRLLYGERDDPAAVLTQLAQQLETADTPTAILPNLVQTIAHTLKIPHVAIWLPTAEKQFEPAAVWGAAPDHVEMLPLTYQNETIGHLVVAPRGPRESFSRHEKQLLQTIAALTANTVRAVQLSDELRQSRQRIVTAREDERRRLRRDLHDGLGPQLASQTLGLEAVGQLMSANPEKANQLLDSLKTQAQEAIADIRRLIYELRPPTLDDLGLVDALQQSAARYESEKLRFTFEIREPLPELPAAVETAVYRITQEAMTNIVRHAQASQAAIRLTCSGNHLVVEICDNGKGLSAAYQAGVGLQSMRERAAELNGRCMIESLPEGGTKVEARLPLETTDE
jgi:signal transduction histidine kinase